MPQLNIKNEEAHALASQLAEATGESMSAAVTEAIRERLQRVKPTESREGVAERIKQITEQFKSLPVRDPRPIQEIMDDLYDENGLPA